MFYFLPYFFRISAYRTEHGHRLARVAQFTQIGVTPDHVVSIGKYDTYCQFG